MPVPVLTIAESDPSGGAGLQADLKTFHQHGVYGMAVVTQLTVQNTQSLFRIEPVPARLVVAQFDAVVSDIHPVAAKTGALGGAETILAIAERAAALDFPLVVDPVILTRDGTAWLGDDAIAVMREHLLPHAFLLTPNMHEAAVLLGKSRLEDEELEDAAEALAELGPTHVVITGDPARPRVEDVLFTEGTVRRLTADRVPTTATHGTGCVFSAALTARVAGGLAVADAVIEAKKFITRALRTQPGLGFGAGPVNMHVSV